MGNINSDLDLENKNKWKVFKIESVEDKGDFFRINLDGYVNYSNGKGKFFDLDTSRNWIGNRPKVPTYFRDVGNRVAINQYLARKHESFHSFKIDGSVIFYINERYARNEFNLIEGIGGATGETLEFFGEIAKTRENYQAAIEYGNWAKQIPGWTSYDMP